MSKQTKKKQNPLPTSAAVAFTAAVAFIGMFWVVVAILLKSPIFLYLFTLCLFLSLILLIEHIKVFDRYLFIRPFSETTIKDLRKEKNLFINLLSVVGLSYMLVGITAIAMPYWFAIRVKRMIVKRMIA